MSDSLSNELDLSILTDEDIREARARLWEKGILHWKLDVTQKKLYDFFHGKTDKTIVVNASRRLGKSFFLLVLALEQCIQKPKSIVKFIQPETGMIRKNINPDFEEMLLDCPADLRPKFMTQDSMWVFPNGSKIHLVGTDNGNYDKLRGSNAHLALIDEAGFCNDLAHIIKSILIPTTTLTRGRIVLSSTTPPDPNHEFIAYMQLAESNGTLIRKTILDAVEDHKNEEVPRITQEIIADIIKSYINGIDDEGFRTEYLCEVIYNSSDAVLPEFTKEIQQDTVVEWPTPPFCDKYVSMDIGFQDLTVVLFAYWDFDHAVLVVEDEYVINGPEMTTKRLATDIMEKEEKLWRNKLTGEYEKPYIRVSDNNLILLNDLQREYGLTFLPTDKQNKDAYINMLRNMISNRQIIVKPNCKTLISHMKLATWDKSRKSFKRSGDNGHFDAVDSLAYLVRNLDMSRNPYPRGYNMTRMGNRDNLFLNPNYDEQNEKYSKFKKLFERKSSFSKKK